MANQNRYLKILDSPKSTWPKCLLIPSEQSDITEAPLIGAISQAPSEPQGVSVKDWKLLAKSLDLQIPEAELDQLARALEGIEGSFRPLVDKIPLECEPAYILLRLPEEPR